MIKSCHREPEDRGGWKSNLGDFNVLGRNECGTSVSVASRDARDPASSGQAAFFRELPLGHFARQPVSPSASQPVSQ